MVGINIMCNGSWRNGTQVSQTGNVIDIGNGHWIGKHREKRKKGQKPKCSHSLWSFDGYTSTEYLMQSVKKLLGTI
eukprot:5510451-Amphidinium_carterae.1